MPGSQPSARCPIRLGEPCTLCVPGATGPQDCGLVYLVRNDPELLERLQDLRTHRGSTAASPGTPTSPTGEAS